MRQTDYEQVQVQCPFYKEDSAKYHNIVCEGVLSGTTNSIRFNSERLRLSYMQAYCKSVSRCSKCPVYEMAMLKYDE